MFTEENRNAVKIFIDFQEALVWLAKDKQEVKDLMDFVNNVASQQAVPCEYASDSAPI